MDSAFSWPRRGRNPPKLSGTVLASVWFFLTKAGKSWETVEVRRSTWVLVARSCSEQCAQLRSRRFEYMLKTSNVPAVTASRMQFAETYSLYALRKLSFSSRSQRATLLRCADDSVFNVERASSINS